MVKNAPKLVMLTDSGCSGGTCPALYKDGEGRVFVHGKKLDARSKSEIAVGENEDVVEITKELIAFLTSQNLI